MDEKKMENLRHSCAHLLAAAVLEIWPQVKQTIGPAIENGFYYDFDFGGVKLSEEDLPLIEEKMRELVKNWQGFKKIEATKKKAKEQFSNNPYKLELIEEFDAKKEKLTFYQSGDYIDLCRGGHIENPKAQLKHFKLLSLAGAYWRGNEKNKMLTRIYGAVFETKEELEKYLKILEEAKKRDHRKLGKQLDLFTFSELVGSGFPLYTPKGAFIRNALNEYIEKLQKQAGYTQVWTPQVAKADLFKTSGHYEKYKDSMFRVISNYSEEEFYLKPMNCPQHTQIYASQLRSYRDLPLRYTDFAMLYRDEKPGELCGLARTRSFSQDDCHVFCREDQVDEEIDKILAMTKEVMKTFGFKYRYRLSTRGKDYSKYIGDPKIWDKVEKWAEKIMRRNSIEYFEGPGEATFYAPKIDLMATDALGREWQLATVQIDFVMPERFDLKYIDKDGKSKRPVMIHRAIIGSPERFMMILLEHYAGALPLWLSPVQVAILPISERHIKTARKVYEKLKAEGWRTELNKENKTISSKIREATLQKIPYMVIIGAKETADKISIRTREGKDMGQMEFDKLTAMLKSQTKNSFDKLDLVCYNK